MTSLFRYAPSATLAALLLTCVESIRLVLLDTVVFDGVGDFSGVFFAISGLVGWPLCLLGTVFLIAYPIIGWTGRAVLS